MSTDIVSLHLCPELGALVLETDVLMFGSARGSQKYNIHRTKVRSESSPASLPSRSLRQGTINPLCLSCCGALLPVQSIVLAMQQALILPFIWKSIISASHISDKVSKGGCLHLSEVSGTLGFLPRSNLEFAHFPRRRRT